MSLPRGGNAWLRKVWDKLLTDVPRYGKAKPYRIMAYSEMMPSPWIGWRPYGKNHPAPRNPEDPFAWLVNEREQAFELGPGLQLIAGQVLAALERLDREQPAQGINRAKLEGNAYWPKELAELPGAIPHERYVTFCPLALSKTQDDKGRVRWTFFRRQRAGTGPGVLEELLPRTGPAKGGPSTPSISSAAAARRPMARNRSELTDLRRAGFRILPGSGEDGLQIVAAGSPAALDRSLFFLDERESLRGVRYLLTFRPFGTLPQAVRKAYLAGRLHLLPFPGSLIFWGAPPFLKLQSELPLAMQIPLLNVCDRHEAPRGLRILQSGWLHEPRAGSAATRKRCEDNAAQHLPPHAPLGADRAHQDELAVAGDEDRLAHVLFSTDPDDVGLYGKPMARNSQIWTDRHELLLDGPRAGRDELSRAAGVLREGGHFGYRFYFPPMRVGKYEVFWHRPLVAYLDAETRQTQAAG